MKNSAHWMKSPSLEPIKLLEIKDLWVNYGGIQALQNINLTVNKGEVVTLIGANGAGKSTTLKAISKIVNPKSGEINYQGRNIINRSPHEIVRRRIHGISSIGSRPA